MEIKVSRQLFPFIYILKMSLDKQIKKSKKRLFVSIVELIHICLYKMHLRLNKLWSIEKKFKNKTPCITKRVTHSSYFQLGEIFTPQDKDKQNRTK